MIEKRLMMFMMMVGLSFIACVLPNPDGADNSSSPSVSNNETCSVVTAIPYPPKSEQDESKAIYILIDNSASYLYADPEERKGVIQLINGFLGESLDINDEVGVGLIGVGAPITAFPVTTISESSYPELPPASEISDEIRTPTPLSDSAPLVVKERHKQENCKIVEEYNLEIESWNERANKKINEKLEQEENNKQALLTEINDKLALIPSEGETDIFSALFSASLLMDDAREREIDQLMLLILSDMSHYVENLANSSQNSKFAKNINFEDVIVVAAMVPYINNSVAEFDAHQDDWEDWMLSKNVKRFEYLGKDFTNQKRLSDILKEEK